MKRIYQGLLMLVCLIVLDSKTAYSQVKKERTLITVSMQGAIKCDTMSLFLFENSMGKLLNSIYGSPVHFIRKKNQDSLFQFEVEMDKPVYISIVCNSDKRGAKLLYYYLVEPSDNILIKVLPKVGEARIGHLNDAYFSGQYSFSKDTIAFSGHGSHKYTCRYLADNFAAFDRTIPKLVNSNSRQYNIVNHFDVSLQSSLTLLELYRSHLSNLVYQTMRADFIGKYEGDKREDFSGTWINASVRKGDSVLMQTMKTFYNDYLTSLSNISEEVLLTSDSYAYALIDHLKLSKLITGFPSDIGSFIMEKYKGMVHDKLLTMYMLRFFKNLPDGQQQLLMSMEKVKTPFWHEQLVGLNGITVGQPFYEFSLPDVNGKIVKLTQFRGRVVFLDFWFTGCTACLAFYQHQLREVEKKFHNNPDIVFITISIDRDKAIWKKSVDLGNYTSGEAINLFTEGMGGDHLITKKSKIQGYPSPFLIDRQGYIINSSDKILRNKEDIITLIEKALSR